MKTKLISILSIAVTVYCSLLMVNCKAQGGIITTVAGTGTLGFSGDSGQATAAKINYPFGIVLDVSGNLYIADSDNSRIRKVTTAGVITTIAGNGTFGYSGDNGPATAAELETPQGLALDASGNLYIADNGNQRIRKVSPSGIITTIAGNGTAGYSGDNGPAIAAELYQPYAIALDATGNIFIADGENNVIRKINTAGIISTIAGNGTAGFSGDNGPATAAELNFPSGLVFDALGNLYIGDFRNKRIRVVNTAGIISTFAGNGLSGFSGDNGPATAATLYGPVEVAIDASGNLYIADEANNRIRMVNTAGVITTVAGNGTGGFSGDNGPATSAALDWPEGVAIDAAGNLYFSDFINQRVRKVSACIAPVMPTSINGYSDICNNSSATYSVTAVSGATDYTWAFPSGWSGASTTNSISLTTSPISGSISVTANNSCGASSTQTLSVTVNALPTILVNSGAICSGSSFTMSPSGASTYTYSSGSAVISPTTTTSYSVTGTSLQGCVSASSAVSTVTVNVIPIVTVVSNMLTLCSGDTATLTASSASTYTWNTTATTATIAVTPTINTTYTVMGTDANGCENMATITQTVSNCSTGIERYNGNETTVYPNPNNGSFTIESTYKGNQTLQIYDMNGKLVIAQTINGKTNINAISLSEGIYNISLISNEGVINKRLVIFR